MKEKKGEKERERVRKRNMGRKRTLRDVKRDRE